MNVKTNIKSGFNVEPILVDAGPIWSDNDAKYKCPIVCANVGMTSNGEWITLVQGQDSACYCIP